MAMGNADARLKAAADYVAPTNDEDGVADVVERFILQTRKVSFCCWPANKTGAGSTGLFAAAGRFKNRSVC